MSSRNVPLHTQLWLYREFYRAFLINKQGGYKEQTAFSRRQLRSVTSLGQVTRAEVQKIQRETRLSLAVTNALLDGFLMGHRAQVGASA